MNGSAHSQDAPFAVTDVASSTPLPAHVGTSTMTSHTVSASSPVYRRHTATQSPLVEDHRPSTCRPEVSTDPLTPSTISATGVAPDMPASFTRLPLPRATPPPAESNTGEDDKSTLLFTSGVGTARTVSAQAIAQGSPLAEAFNLDEFALFHAAAARSSMDLIPQSPDDSLRSSLDHNALVGYRSSILASSGRHRHSGLATGMRVSDASFVSGTTHSATPRPPTQYSPAQRAIAPRNSIRGPITSVTAAFASGTDADAATASGVTATAVGSRRLTGAECGPLAPHRLLPDAVLGEVCTFLELAGREMEDVALRHAIENGESCLFTAGEDGGSIHRHRDGAPAQRRLSAMPVSPPYLRTAGPAYGGGGAHQTRPPSSSNRDAQENQEEDILRLVDATCFPFREKYNGYRFPESWLDTDRPMCEVSGVEDANEELDEEIGRAGSASTRQAGVRGGASLVGSSVHACVALTEDPPLAISGMLFDPVSGRFLFQGRAFYEETRVLTTLLYPKGSPHWLDREVNNLPGTPIARTTTTTTTVPGSTQLPMPPTRSPPQHAGAPAPSAPTLGARRAEEGRPVKVLQRDCFALSKPDECGFMVQSFSLLPVNTPVEAHKQQLVSTDVVERVLLPLVGAATLTRAFPLSYFACDAPPSEASVSTVEDKAPRRDTAAEGLPVRRNPAAGLHSPDVTVGSSSRSARVSASLDDCPRPSVVSRCPPPPTLTSRPSTSYNAMGGVGSGGGGARELMVAVDAIKTHLIYYGIGRFRACARLYLCAVRRVQRFLRFCLAKKQRALQRMMRLWRRLEVESRLKLAHYEAPPSSVERVNLVANTILQQHMLTTRESKVRLITDLWQQRHLAYVQWLHRADGRRAIHTTAPSQPGVVEEADDVIERPPVPHQVAQRLSRTAVLASIGPVCTLTDAQRRTQVDRDQALRHDRFGWYMSPESLLLESHKRLLEGLKQSVLSMEQVRYELERAAAVDSAASRPPKGHHP